MPRRPSSRGFVRGPRRLTSWALGPGGYDIATLDRQQFTASQTLIIGSGVTPIIDNLTVVRIRGFIDFGLRSADAVLAGFNFVAGIGIVSGDAFAIGVTATPNPFDDTDWPGWLWLGSGSSRTSVAALAVGDPSDNP